MIRLAALVFILDSYLIVDHGRSFYYLAIIYMVVSKRVHASPATVNARSSSTIV
jgi:hypothetical protein